MAQKVEVRGGRGGNQWDDGADHENVTKIYVGGGREGIQYVKFDYIKSGQTQEGIVHGVEGNSFTELFEIDHLNDEYLVSVNGRYDNTSGVIQALQFETNMRISKVIGYDNGSTFTLEVSGKKIVGFYGSVGLNLKSLGAYVTTIPPVKLEQQGGTGGSPWDHGVYTGVRKVYVTYSPSGISHIMVDYDKAGKVETLQNGDMKGEDRVQRKPNEFVLDYPSEYITSVEGTCDLVPGKSNRVRSLSFKTSKGRISPTYGKVGKKAFVLESKGRALVGFHGRDGWAIDAIGAYFTTIPPIKLEQQGGSGGSPWDHGVYMGVRKVYLTCSPTGVSHIMVDYDKDGKVETLQNGDRKGENRVQGKQYEFILDYPNEYIISVTGTCDNQGPSKSNRVRSLSFTTSNERTSPTYGTPSNKTFVLESKGRALVGFHGRAGWAIDAIGAYFGLMHIPCPPPVEKLQAEGGDGGALWDDGAFHGVRKIYVGEGEHGVECVKFVYGKNSQVVLGEDHGNKTMLRYEEFKLEHPSEYIIAVEGSYGQVFGSEPAAITMLKFKTNVRTSPSFGLKSSSTFLLGKEGHKVVGFHGKASDELYQLGVSVTPISK